MNMDTIGVLMYRMKRKIKFLYYKYWSRIQYFCIFHDKECGIAQGITIAISVIAAYSYFKS